MIGLKKVGSYLTALFVGAAGAHFYHQHNAELNALAEAEQAQADAEVNDIEVSWVLDLLQEGYVNKNKVADRDTLKAKAIEGVLSYLDPHSSYLTPEEIKEAFAAQQEFVGIGVELGKESDNKIYVWPIPQSPAERAGIKDGDIITHVDDISVTGLDLDGLSKKIRGDENTPVKIKVERKGQSNPLEITVLRGKVVTHAVSAKAIGNDIGYIRIKGFDEKDMASSLRQGIGEIKTALHGNVNGYIIDLRGNPGGSLNEAISVSDSFLEKGTIVSSLGRTDENNTMFEATPGDMADGKPIIVLIDNMSASASEIVAGALQDNGRAKIMGLQSFGKGSVQHVHQLGPLGGFKYTAALYFTPSGRSIQGIGVTPDIAVKSPKIDAMMDAFKKAGFTPESGLKDSIANPNPNAPDPVKTQAVCSPKEKAPFGKDESVDRRGKRDEMLLCAIEELRGVQNLTTKAPVEPKAPGIS